MLKFFERNNSCDIILEQPLSEDDNKLLDRLLNKEYTSWHIVFGRIYNIDVNLVKILYMHIMSYKKNVKITTHKHKLNRYLYRLGFKTNFESLIEKNVVDIESIKVVLVGGSADSSEKIIEIVKKINLDNLTLILVQHVNPNTIGIFDEILKQHTKYKVSYAKDNESIDEGHIYLARRDKHLEVKNGRFHLSDKEKYNYARPSISISYESFSNYYKEKLLVIQECGYANDGVDKLKLLHNNKTKILIQDVDECEAKEMPEKALDVGVDDYILNLKNIKYFIELISIEEEKLLYFLKELIFKKYKYDFRHYFDDMFNRRVEIFMSKHRIKNLRNAIGVIIFNKSAFMAFFLEVSINVTELFRHEDSLAKMMKFFYKHYTKNHNIKIWSAGCSSGEEPYSIGILLDMIGMLDKTTIYATDFNEVVLSEAKNAIYQIDRYKTAKEKYKKIGLKYDLEDYVDIYDNFIMISDKIKKKVLFFQHNLVSDGSFNEFDIIICKNVIIYFDDNLQDDVFELFYNSLRFGGHLILGNSENISLKFSKKFKKCNENLKIFKKVS